MTRKRIDSHSTEFGLWIREQKEVDSSLGYLATNIDFMWTNYKTGLWMLIEEKRYNSKPKFWQQKMFEVINAVCKLDKNYCGFHLIVFENTSPDDGKIFIDNNEVSKEYLIQFLQKIRI